MTLVETAWNLGLSPHLIKVQHDIKQLPLSEFFRDAKS